MSNVGRLAIEPDFACSFGDADEHDVGDTDTADDETDSGDAVEDQAQSLGGFAEAFEICSWLKMAKSSSTPEGLYDVFAGVLKFVFVLRWRGVCLWPGPKWNGYFDIRRAASWQW